MPNPATNDELSLRGASFSRDGGGGHDRDHGHDSGHGGRSTRRDDASRGPRHPPSRLGHVDGSSSNPAEKCRAPSLIPFFDPAPILDGRFVIVGIRLVATGQPNLITVALR